MKTVRTVLSAPSEVFRRMESHPTWRLIFLVVVAGNVLLTWLKSCLRGPSFVINLSVIAGSFISISVILLLLWSVLSLFLYLFSILLNAQRRFNYRIAFSLVSHCGIIFLVGECANFILLRLGLLKSTSLLLPNRFPIGLDLLFIGRVPSLSLVVVSHSINPFTIWYFATMALGISMLWGISKSKAGLVVISAWAISIALTLILISAAGGTSIGVKAV